jgi:AhpD family alkylhydroperoxidase
VRVPRGVLAVSLVNDCSYRVAAHSMIADRLSGVPALVLNAIRAGGGIPDPKLAALHAMTTEMVRRQTRLPTQRRPVLKRVPAAKSA